MNKQSTGVALDLTYKIRKFAPPLTLSHNIMELAKRAAQAMSERHSEDIEEWAHNLALEIKDSRD